MADPLVGAAIVTAAGQLVGSGVEGHFAGKGLDAQERARREALQFEREREEQRRREHAEQQRLLQQQYEAYQAYRQPFRAAAHSIVGKYFPGIGAPPPPPSQVPEGWAPPTAPGMGRAPDYSGFSIGASPAAGMVTPPISGGYTLGGA